MNNVGALHGLKGRDRLTPPKPLSAMRFARYTNNVLSYCTSPDISLTVFAYFTEIGEGSKITYRMKFTAFCSRFSRPWSYLITVFGSRWPDIICTWRYDRP